ncbi:ribosome-releasing factor 2, mitochondrial, partial [Diaphorina citri]|uniref:Ribosome-releasing factor 2, mitochondrial n=1 Tax=Diaphorina citri TaxID=121845 RepID=A0A1S4ECD3_DIACI
HYSKNVAAKPIKSVKLNSNISKIRNIGISAHIDAGKTTTTERMLFYSGLIKHMGEVHDGNTVTDYMEQERNRGITIRSAAVSINWQNHVINIIDTPGHIDFTMEVEQALNVMDGAVIILDASAGVEAQTLTVWRQADKFSIPRLVYLNKMDRPDANLDLCVKSLRDRFGVTPLVLQIPIIVCRIPDPVFFCSIEPPSQSTQVALEEALSQLQREDPSLRVDTSPDTGQTVLGGMGELHLEIIRDRILTEYKIEADLGPLQIAYKETVLSPAMASHEHKIKIGTQEHRVLIKLSVLPTTPGKPFPLVSLDTDPDYSENTSLIYPRRLQCIKSGVDSALVSGPKLGCPVVGVRVLVHWLEVGRHTSDPVISSCTTQCVHKALKEAGCILLEPYMYLEIISDEQYVHGILADLSRRRADIRSVEDRGSSKVIIAEAPLSELLGYCQRVRTLSSGRSHFSMEFLCFKQVSSQNEAQAVRNITGFDPV